MTRKRILNATSRKKRDTMTTYSNTSSSGASTTPAQQPLVINASPSTSNFPGVVTGAQGLVLFTPTARTLIQFGGGSGTVVQESMRTATTCYMRGLSEHIRIQTSTALPWLWRRICFASKDVSFRTYQVADTPGTTILGGVETSSGYQRAAINQSVNGSGNTQNQIFSILFKGAQGIDWTDVILAPVDTRRVDLKSDKTTRMFSGNQDGAMRESKFWHPMNKNITYADDESGEVETSSAYSVNDKRGMGDYHVLDIFACGLGGSATDQLAVQYNSSLYWHEK